MESNAFIIFGATGDLTARKLLPALYNLAVEGKLSEKFFCVSIGRRVKNHLQFIEETKTSIEMFSRNKFDNDIWDNLKSKFFYFEMSFDEEEKYKELDEFLKKKEEEFDTKGNRIYYLAVSPDYFEVIVNHLYINNMTRTDEISWKRVMIEKPFGNDLASAKKLSKVITTAFKEENTYRIDHYLGKEMLQNIMVLRFSNEIFEPIWNNRYIDHIQIISSETQGIQNRGGYYEKSGALKDMLQNHLMQILSVVAMESPVNLDTESIRDEKVKVLRSIRKMDESYIKTNIVKAQYGKSSHDSSLKSYREEEKVDKNSNVETFVAAKFMVDNYRWNGVPFYILTAKRMPKTITQVVIQFKSFSNLLYKKSDEKIENNKLIIRIQPDEGIHFSFNAKKLGSSDEIRKIQMDYCQNNVIGYNSPEAYEMLILAAVKGDKTMFTRWDEVEYSWEIIDNIIDKWDNDNIEIYESNSYGPTKAIDLIEKDNRKWEL